MAKRTKAPEEKRRPARRPTARRRTEKPGVAAGERPAARTPRAKAAAGPIARKPLEEIPPAAGPRPARKMSLRNIAESPAARRAATTLLTAATRVLRGGRRMLDRLRGFREEESGV
jgi:hypothetical protein